MAFTLDMEQFLGRAVAELRRLFPEVDFVPDVENFQLHFKVNGRSAFLNLDNAYHAECVALMADALGEPAGLMTGCEYIVRAYQAVANRPRSPGRPTPVPTRRRRPSSRRQFATSS